MNNSGGGGISLLVLMGLYLVLSIAVGIKADNRKFGFWGGFLTSFFFTPIIGFIVTLFSKTLDEQKLEQEMLENQKEQTRLLAEKSENNTISIADEIEKLISLKEKGLLTEEEFQQAKQRLINKD